MLLVIIGLPYLGSPVYQFPEPAPFSGPRFYNPYDGIRGSWQRANLHAHGAAWGGITNGAQTSADVARTYRGLGYDIAGVSNYHDIATARGVDTLPLYEHGYNVRKRHQLAIGATRVEWLDFPLWQALSQEQFIIDRVGRTAALVGLTHPDSRDAYSDDALQQLTGYQFIEVVNGPFASTAPWDSALSSGHAVWAMANDDTHDTTDPRRTAMAWNMIDAPSSRLADVVDAMRAGRSIAVERHQGAPADMDVRLLAVTLTGGTLAVSTEGVPVTIEFIGQSGAARAAYRDTHAAEYAIKADDPYIRPVINSANTTLFLNPIVRSATTGVPALPQEGSRLDKAERELLLKALESAEWNVTRAAKLLGVSRDTLRYRMERHCLARPMQDAVSA